MELSTYNPGTYPISARAGCIFFFPYFCYRHGRGPPNGRFVTAIANFDDRPPHTTERGKFNKTTIYECIFRKKKKKKYPFERSTDLYFYGVYARNTMPVMINRTVNLLGSAAIRSIIYYLCSTHRCACNLSHVGIVMCLRVCAFNVSAKNMRLDCVCLERVRNGVFVCSDEIYFVRNFVCLRTRVPDMFVTHGGMSESFRMVCRRVHFFFTLIFFHVVSRNTLTSAVPIEPARYYFNVRHLAYGDFVKKKKQKPNFTLDSAIKVIKNPIDHIVIGLLRKRTSLVILIKTYRCFECFFYFTLIHLHSPYPLNCL